VALRVAWALIFLLLLGEAVFLAPPRRPDQSAWLWQLITGQWADIDPWVVAHFQLMGVWPLTLAALLGPTLSRRPVPLWPFALGSMALGAFALLPGLVLGGVPSGCPRWLGWLRHRGMLGALTAATLGLVGWAAVAGSPAAWWAAFRTEQFVHVMACDFVVLWVTSVSVAWWRGGPWALATVPILGALAYVASVQEPAAKPST